MFQINRKSVKHLCLMLKRHYSLPVRVRFAPSPTGYLHLGGLRTALYNHLFAKANQGTTILRIEDTDQERLVTGAVDQLIEDLGWCGLKYDEGPILQSSRLPLYKTHIEELIDRGHAYRCFCSPVRLDLVRRNSIKAGEVPKYDNRCRNLSKEDIEEKLKDKLEHCVRFKLHSCLEPFNDLVYGTITQDIASLEGDPVILKTDGFPTYHFANVVDDHDMGITHVLRGVEWQGSTKKHILIYKAFEWNSPQYAHLPLLLNPDGTKLSKRQGDVHVGHYRKSGVFPQALLNFVVRAGGGFDIEHSERDEKSFTFEELVEKFDILKLKGSSCKVEFERLKDSNRLELKRKLTIEKELDRLVEEVQEKVIQEFANSKYSDSLDLSKHHIKKTLTWAQNRIHYLSDLTSPSWKFLWVVPTPGELSSEEQSAVKWLLPELSNAKFEKEELKKILKECSVACGFKFADLMKLLRRLLSGLKEGPGVVELFEILGKETTLRRLQGIKVKEKHQTSAEI